MKEIHATTQLESEKSGFVIDLVKNDKGSFYIEIVQNIYGKNEQQAIKINPAVLGELIKVLQNYHEKIPAGENIHRTFLSEKDKMRIQERYLKGVSIDDLALQFDNSPELIEMVLKTKNIVVVPNEVPRFRYFRRRKNKF